MDFSANGFDLAVPLIKRFEGLSLAPYTCPAGVLTIGYGSTRWPGGRPINKADRLADKGQAETLLIYQLESEFLPKLQKIPFWNEMTRHQRAALLSFAFNVGENFYGAEGFDTISRVLRTRSWGYVPDAFRLYDKADGRVMEGLVTRRKIEGDLWLGNDIDVALEQPVKKQDKQGKTMTGIHYFLDFTMPLDADSVLEGGRLVLRSISESGGNTHTVWIATSGTASGQKPEAFHQRGTALPPEYRMSAKAPWKSWEVETKPIYLPQVKGVEGNFYKITPFTVKTDKGGERGDLGIHRDANVPGSAGCIVMSAERFKSFEAQMKRLADLGYTKIPLYVTYPTD